MFFFYEALLSPQTARHDNFAIPGERLADRPQGFLDRGVDEAAGVDDDQVGARVIGRGGVAFGAQLREDALGVYQCFRTAEGDEPDLGRGGGPVLLPRAFYRNRRAGGIRGR